MEPLYNIVVLQGQKPVDRSMSLSGGQMFFVDIDGRDAVVMITDDIDTAVVISGVQQGSMVDTDTIEDYLMLDNLLAPFDTIGKLNNRT